MAAKTDAIRKLVEERLAELDQEREELQEALAELIGRKGPGRPRGTRSHGRSASAAGSRPGRRRRKGGTRAEHAERAIADNPGIKASEIATQLKIKPNYVYRVLADLVKEGRVSKQGTGYFPPANSGTEVSTDESTD
ncbi:MAG TPA: winged helix-turn-helix domain-containing protein [Microthrixaceae bacterium]|nr:winged helix-turn-helix domain-containing protein [Microthrixaceae bacterium]